MNLYLMKKDIYESILLFYNYFILVSIEIFLMSFKILLRFNILFLTINFILKFIQYTKD